MLARAYLLFSAILLLPLALGAQEMVITKPGTPLYHWPGCPVIKDTSEVLAMTRAQANGRGLKPHEACDPSKGPAEPTAPKMPVVYIDEDDKLYHRETCDDLADKRSKVTVDEAVKKKRWPCRECKPPIRPRGK